VIASFLWIAAVVLTVLGLWLIVLNWTVFWRRHIRKQSSSSWIPLLGGALLCAGFVVVPNNPCRWLWWLAFVVDWGSVPGITYSVVWHVLSRKGSSG